MKTSVYTRPPWTLSEDAPQYPWLSGNASCDAVVLGGTLAAILIAYELSKKGVDVTLLAPAEIGAEDVSFPPAMTRLAAASLSRLAKRITIANAVRVFHDYQDAIESLASFCEHHDIPFVRRDALLFAKNRMEQSFLEEEYRIRRHNGFAVEWVNADELRDITSVSCSSALLLPHACAVCDPCALAHALLVEAVNLGARIFEHTPVTLLTGSCGRFVLTTEAQREVKAKRIVCAGEVPRSFAPSLSKITRVVRMVVSSPVSDFSGYEDKPVLLPAMGQPMILCTHDDRVAVISSALSSPVKDSPDAPCYTQLEEQCSEMLCGVRPSFPDVRTSENYLLAPNGLPYCAPAKEEDGIFVLSPGSPDILTAAFVTAPIVSSLCTGSHPFHLYDGMLK